VADELDQIGLPVVVDPVCVSTTGATLLTPGALDVYRFRLIPRATVVTPNIPEVRALTDVDVSDVGQLREAAAALFALGPQWVLVKGGHLDGVATDLLYDGVDEIVLPGERIDTRTRTAPAAPSRRRSRLGWRTATTCRPPWPRRRSSSPGRSGAATRSGQAWARLRSGCRRQTSEIWTYAERTLRRVTLPALMHEVHTLRRLGVDLPTIARTRWMFGFQRRRLRRWENETAMPKPGPLPQTSHTEATTISLEGRTREGPGTTGQPAQGTQRPLAQATEVTGG
jgi:hypothetical protein